MMELAARVKLREVRLFVPPASDFEQKKRRRENETSAKGAAYSWLRITLFVWMYRFMELAECWLGATLPRCI